MPNQAKITAVSELKELFEGSDSFFVTDYHGLNVADITVLRKDLRDKNVKYLVAKNTLFLIGAKEAGVEGLDKYLTGPTAVAFTSEDPAVAAKILNESFKKRELPRMKVFVVDKIKYPAEDIGKLADLPSREQLLSNLVAAVEAPFSELIGSLDGFFRKLIGSVDALADKRKSEG